MRQRRWSEYVTQTAVAAQAKSPQRIQADGGGGGVYKAMLVRRAQRTFDAAASIAPSWPRLKRSAFAFSVIRADHTVTVHISPQLDNGIARLSDCTRL
jgi:hypothetical protein